MVITLFEYEASKVRPVRSFEIAAAVILTAGGLYAFAGQDESTNGMISVKEAWARPTLGKSANSDAYLTITNAGSRADKLLSVGGGAAERIELHEHVRDGNTMRMRRVSGGLEIAAGATKALEPGGQHITLIGVAAPLNEGGKIALKLEFEHAGEISVSVPVRRRSH